MPRYRGPIPAQEIWRNSVPGAVFSHRMPKMDFYDSHRFSWEKTHLNDMPWYINKHQPPFIDPMRIDRKKIFLKVLGKREGFQQCYALKPSPAP